MPCRDVTSPSVTHVAPSDAILRVDPDAVVEKVRLEDPALDQVLAPTATVEKVALSVRPVGYVRLMLRRVLQSNESPTQLCPSCGRSPDGSFGARNRNGRVQAKAVAMIGALPGSAGRNLLTPVQVSCHLDYFIHILSAERDQELCNTLRNVALGEVPGKAGLWASA